MTEKKIKNNMSSSGLTRRSRNGVESGRSMVEMLGVLAVVGVLSVGGIAGYTYAMNKHYANELLMGASERAVLVSAQILVGKKPNLNEFANHTVPNGTFGEVKTDIADGFGITVSGVKDAVCENLKKVTEETDVSIANDDERLSDVTCSGDNNAFMFVFDYGVSGGAGEETNPDDNNDTPVNPSENCPAGTSSDGEGEIAKTLSDGTVCKCLNANEIYDSEQGCTTPANPCDAICGDGWNCELIDGKCVANAHATANGMWECFNSAEEIRCVYNSAAVYICIDNPDIVEEIDCSSGSSQSYIKYADIGSYTLCTSLPVTCPNSGGGIPSGPIIPPPAMPNN